MDVNLVIEKVKNVIITKLNTSKIIFWGSRVKKTNYKGSDIAIESDEDINKSFHIYDENTSNEIFDRIKNFYIKSFEEFLKNIDKI